MIATAVTGDVRERSAVRWGSDGGAGRWSHPWDRSRDIATRGACWSGFQGRSCQAAPQLVVLPQGRGPASAVGLRLASSSPRLVGLGRDGCWPAHRRAAVCGPLLRIGLTPVHALQPIPPTLRLAHHKIPHFTLMETAHL
ncbi:hypothetical protein OPV22_014952 [Ensete ventricosum]|uniref:Uncharacterized protein n=1 Tax=Ensete ventricosum TaxID=4639 RepID=A0AAV8RD16_ENSVE|nr:hypothetical protein OPV22_014952 [Ensete ventricosum]